MQSAQIEADDLFSEITFGVELEFLAPPDSVLQNGYGKYPDHIRKLIKGDHAFHHLATALQQAGLQAAYLFETEDGDCEHYQLRSKAPGGSIIKTGVSSDMRIMSASSYKNTGENPLFRYWLLKAENEVAAAGKYQEWQPTELNSPILKEVEANNGLESLNKALRALHDAHPEKPLHVNDGCGIHVHVAPARGVLTALHVKRVATLVYLLEDHLLFHLCDPHRRIMHGLLSDSSAMAALPPPTQSLSASAAINLPQSLLKSSSNSSSSSSRLKVSMMHLWQASTATEAGNLIYRNPQAANSKLTALHVNAHHHPVGHKTYTIEFRHAEASLNEAFVDNWLRLVLTLCKVAFLPSQRYRDIVSLIDEIVMLGGCSKPERVWAKLLRALNDAAPRGWVCLSEEEFWRGHLAAQKRM